MPEPYARSGLCRAGGDLTSVGVRLIDRLVGSAGLVGLARTYIRQIQRGRPDEALSYGHAGGAPGMNAILRVYPESGQSVMVLCSLDSSSAPRLGDWLNVRMPLK